jgi:hypothetical protein
MAKLKSRRQRIATPQVDEGTLSTLHDVSDGRTLTLEQVIRPLTIVMIVAIVRAVRRRRRAEVLTSRRKRTCGDVAKRQHPNAWAGELERRREDSAAVVMLDASGG